MASAVCKALGSIGAPARDSPAIRAPGTAWEPQRTDGVTPAEMVRDTRDFPELFDNLYSTGELTGSLDDALRRIHRLYQEDGERQLQMVADWTPKLVYFGVVILVAWQAIRFWTGYFDQINQVITQ